MVELCDVTHEYPSKERKELIPKCPNCGSTLMKYKRIKKRHLNDQKEDKKDEDYHCLNIDCLKIWREKSQA